MTPAHFPTDLSKEAILERRRTEARTGREGGPTGRELAATASQVFNRAKQLRKIAERRKPGRRRQTAERRADEALQTAATQIRIAIDCPPDRPYLHALSLKQIQEIKRYVIAYYNQDPAALAVDTHRMIQRYRRNTAAREE